jgi:pyruvate/2-oxoglutarate dehydrogenase complex dihydrolipoamide dehydrogenase (E3) component
VQLGKEATAAMVQDMKPDVVFLATGGILTAPDMKGVKNKNVLTTPQLHQKVKPYLKTFGTKFLEWATHYYLPIGKNVIVIGAGLHGTETAEFLIKRGRKVTIVEPSDKIGEGVLDFRFGLLMDFFSRHKVQIISAAKNLEITDKGVSFTDKDGKKQSLTADTVVPTSPLKSNTALLKEIEGKVPELHLIGDAKEPRMIVHAIREGYQTAKKI